MSGREEEGNILSPFNVDAGGVEHGSDNTNAEWGKQSCPVRKAGICGCLVECSCEEFPKWLNHPEVDLVEWRMDKFADRHSMEEMKSFLGALSIKQRLPVIATNRPVREMGAFAGREDLRLSMLEEAAKSGADWIDLEHHAGMDDIAPFRQRRSKGPAFVAQPCRDPLQGDFAGKAGEHAQDRGRCFENSDHGPIGRR